MERPIGLTIAAAVKAHAVRLARRCRNRGHPAESGERRLGSETIDVLAGGDEQLGGVLSADAHPRHQSRCRPVDQSTELLVGRDDLLVQGVDPPRNRPQGHFRRLGRIVESCRVGAPRRGERHVGASAASPQ